MIRISGYGQSGPYSKRPGYGIICEAVGGLRHLTGDPDRPPARVAISLTDYITGLYGFAGGLLALLHRQSSGLGQCIDAALYESAFSLMEQHVAAYKKLGIVATRTGPGTGSAPNNLYMTKDREHVHIAANSNPIFRRLMETIGKAGLARDVRFSTAVARAKNRKTIDGIISRWTARHNIRTIEEILQNAQVPATRIFTLADIFEDPHYRARETIAHVDDDELGSVPLAAIVPRLSATPGKIRHTGRRIGADTKRILGELGGLTSTEISKLEKAKVIFCEKSTSRSRKPRKHAAGDA
jgi:crotonobetainyl-CoA:carnitine CoA-transferase CaiB-like acyl-CoA transferase